ncbi:MAG TPA: hypothetical protein VM911_17350 [Pyrinomonadaceae bacterium]|nr:hypothetical protein [Pyrinomonadaceae bacterium]
MDRSLYSSAIEAARLVASPQLRALQAKAFLRQSTSFESSLLLKVGHHSFIIQRGPQQQQMQRRPASRVRPARLAPWLVDRALPPLHYINTRTNNTKHERPGKSSSACARVARAEEEPTMIARRSTLWHCSSVPKGFFRTWQKN